MLNTMYHNFLSKLAALIETNNYKETLDFIHFVFDVEQYIDLKEALQFQEYYDYHRKVTEWLKWLESVI